MAVKIASRTLTVILTIMAFALVASTLAAVTVSQNLTSSGTISAPAPPPPTPTSTPVLTPNVALYSDAACTNQITGISWGALSAGGSASQTVYVKNTGTAPMTLSMSISNWSPIAAGTHITITWNKEGATVAAGQSVAATITLNVSPAIAAVTSYSNTITISGTG